MHQFFLLWDASIVFIHWPILHHPQLWNRASINMFCGGFVRNHHELKPKISQQLWYGKFLSLRKKSLIKMRTCPLQYLTCYVIYWACNRRPRFCCIPCWLWWRNLELSFPQSYRIIFLVQEKIKNKKKITHRHFSNLQSFCTFLSHPKFSFLLSQSAFCISINLKSQDTVKIHSFLQHNLSIIWPTYSADYSQFIAKRSWHHQ